MFVGKVDDEFVFTHRNDVVTWDRHDGVQRFETNLDQLNEVMLYSNGVLFAGDGDEVSALIWHSPPGADQEPSFQPLYDGPLTSGDVEFEYTPSGLAVFVYFEDGSEGIATAWSFDYKLLV